MFESILCQVTEYDPDVLDSLIELAVEIAREGREGRRIGTLFTLGDEQALSWQEVQIRCSGSARRASGVVAPRDGS